MEDMNALSSTRFSVLNHPAFSNYKVNIKESVFCDGTIKRYIDIATRAFFESRNGPDQRRSGLQL
ncbi:hypothetical protein B0H19DRAFT_1258532 [Mycena capillaripes]|nr:hypothetical protein B0H19DRAFT_1258532 [Mycena capillaripes]